MSGIFQATTTVATCLASAGQEPMREAREALLLLKVAATLDQAKVEAFPCSSAMAIPLLPLRPLVEWD